MKRHMTQKTRSKFLSLLLALVLIIGAVPITALPATAAQAYNGTPTEPTKISESNYTSLGLTSESFNSFNGYYAIRTAAELYGFANLVNAQTEHIALNAVLLQDIVINTNVSTSSAYSWTPIGTSSYPYLGTFDGNGHTISGIYINSSSSNVGLFGAFVLYGSSSKSYIKNLTVSNSYICGGSYVGGIVGSVGSSTASIENCKIASDVTVIATGSGNINVGGIVGGFSGMISINTSTYCQIKNCVVFGKIQASNTDNYVGAITCYYRSTDNAAEIITVSSSYYLKNIVTSKSGTLNWGKGGTSATKSNGGCTQLDSRSSSHTCISVEHKEELVSCKWDGCTAYSYCVICEKITSGTKTVTSASSAHHILTNEINCLSGAECIVCGTSFAADSNIHKNSDYAYEYYSETQHKKYHTCCGALEGLENHTYTSSDKVACVYCGAFTSAPKKVTSYNCESLGLSNNYIGYYAISNLQELCWFADLTNGTSADGTERNNSAKAVLIKDIEINKNVVTNRALNSGSFLEWTPIGDYSTNGNYYFKGIFDGNGHTVSGLYINRSDTFTGFCGCLSQYGTIKNLVITGSYFKSSDSYAGGIAGFSYGSVENCTVTNSIIISSNRTGGIAGSAKDKDIVGCGSVNCIITGEKFVGGIAGWFENCKIGNCMSENCTITASNGGRSGGIAGVANGIIFDCYSTSSVIGTQRACGIAGATQNDGAGIINCYFAGQITCDTNTASITFIPKDDENPTINVENCYYISNVSEGVINSCSSATVKDVASATSEEFKSGKITWLLNGKYPGETWKQTLGSDSYPKFSGKTVYAKLSTCSASSATGYSNEVQAVPSHTYVNGICTKIAGKEHYEPAVCDNAGIYEISNAGQLIWFSKLVNGTLEHTKQNQSACARLTSDVDMSGITNFVPIGGTTGLYYSAEGTDVGFKGTFNGNCHVIKNLSVNGSDSKELTYGVFGTLSGAVYNLGVENFKFTVGAKDCRAGGIAGQILSAGSVSNCYVINSTVTATGKVAGGIAGCNYSGKTTNCYTYNVAVTASRTGGIVGDNKSDEDNTTRIGTVENCYTDASSIESGSRAGNVTGSSAGVGESDFKSGKITYLLNGKNPSGIWEQTLGTDSVPNFTGKNVYAKTTICSVNAAVSYNNNSQSITPHVYEDGVCTQIEDEVHYEPALWNEGKNAYEIYNLGQLYWFAALTNGTLEEYSQNVSANANLMSDIKVNENVIANGKLVSDTSNLKEWTPIGDYANNGNKNYSGTFNGNGHTVSGLYIKRDVSRTGFISALSTPGSVKNLTVANSYFENTDNRTGVIVANSKSSVENCHSVNCIVSGANNSGGITGWMNGGNIKNCTSTDCVITGAQYVGGISGSIYAGNITSCTTTNLSATGTKYVGGITGWHDSDYIENCASVNCSIANAVDGRIGGIASVSNGNILNCYCTGTLSATQRAGGIVGVAQEGATVRNCYFVGQITCETNGNAITFVPNNDNSNEIIIDNCYYDCNTENGVYDPGNRATVNNVSGYTAEEFKSGKITWLLNGGSAEGVWKQTLSKDTLPNFTGKTVYFDNGKYYNECDHETYLNGFCTSCGAYEPAVQNGDVYEISNAGQLFWFGELVNGTLVGVTQNTAACGILTDNIDLENRSWISIGTESSPYSGTFNGNGKTILAFQLTASENKQGLFGTVSGGTILNFAIKGKITVSATSSTPVQYIGTVGWAHSGASIEGVTSYLTVTDEGMTANNNNRYIGGIVGFLGYPEAGDDSKAATVKNCRFEGTIDMQTSRETAGVAGCAVWYSEITSCYNYGNIKSGTGACHIGGISGDAQSGTAVTYCINYGDVTSGGADCIGGVVSYANRSAKIDYCANVGTVKCTSESGGYIGGILGYINSNELSSLTSCYNYGLIDTTNGSDNHAGAIVGWCKNSNVSMFKNNCYLDTSYTQDADPNSVSATKMTSLQFSNGEALKLLNGGNTDGAWKQTVGKDKMPNFTSDGTTVLIGDVNGDGMITAKDIKLLKQYVSSAVTSDEIVESNSDVNGDETISVKDIKALKKLLVS